MKKILCKQEKGKLLLRNSFIMKKYFLKSPHRVFHPFLNR